MLLNVHVSSALPECSLPPIQPMRTKLASQQCSTNMRSERIPMPSPPIVFLYDRVQLTFL